MENTLESDVRSEDIFNLSFGDEKLESVEERWP